MLLHLNDGSSSTVQKMRNFKNEASKKNSSDVKEEVKVGTTQFQDLLIFN